MRLGEQAIDATFQPNSNIGLLTGAPSGGLVDVDCDTVEAQIAATTLLPITSMMHGRTDGREIGRFTHCWYQIVGDLPKTEKFVWREDLSPRPPLRGEGARAAADAHDHPGADVAEMTADAIPAERGTPSLPRRRGQGEMSPQTMMLIELRADGCQTMVPPSIHPQGGWLRWGGGQVEPLEPARVTAAGLRQAVARTAAALLARYWPAQGSRDEAALSLAGWLVKAGWTDDEIETFVLATARAALDEEWQRRAGKAAHTHETLAAKKPVMSVSALAARLRGGAAFGAMVVTLVARWLGIHTRTEGQGPQSPGMSPLSAFPVETVGEARLGGTLLSDLQPREVEWLWQDYIPLAAITLLDGNPGLGKSPITLDLAARITTWRGMPDSPDAPDESLRELSGEPDGVVLLSAEDDLARTILPRLRAAGGETTRVYAITDVHETSVDGSERTRPFVLPRDLPILAEGMALVRAKLVVIDPLTAYLDLRVNSWNDQHVRAALAPLARLAEETGASILILRHLNKGAGGSALYRGGGSIGIIGAARSGLLAAKDPDDPEHQRVLASSKSNLGPPPPSLRYRLQPVGDGAYPRVEWLGESHHSAQDLLRAQTNEEGDGDQSALEEARDFLLTFLAEGPRRATEGEEAARAVGIHPTTLRRAPSGRRTTSTGIGHCRHRSARTARRNRLARRVRRPQGVKGTMLRV
jgi:hypothetical protein